MQKVVIVGAGPAGCAAALHLARKPNVQVQLLEKRTLADIVSSADSSRSYPMVLSKRALNTFDSLGLNLPSTSEAYEGIVFLPKRNTMTMSDMTCLVSRTQLANELLRVAAQHENISLSFGTTPASIDLATQRLTVTRQQAPEAANAELLQSLLASDPSLGSFEAATLQGGDADSHHEARRAGSSALVATRLAAALAVRATEYSHDAQQGTPPPETLEYDLLIAADGIKSQVRTMMEALGEVKVRRVKVKNDPSAGRYQTFADVVIPDDADGERYPFAAPGVIPGRNLYFLEASDSKCKLVFWRSDSNHLCGMVPGTANVLSTVSVDKLRAMFGDNIPEWMVHQVAEQLQGQRLHEYGCIVKCSQLHARGGVVMLGDAAHAVTSRFGQGGNMALESVQVFNSVLDECLRDGKGLASVPEAFTSVRMADVAAMQNLEHMHMCMTSGAAHDEAGLDGVELAKFELHSKVALGSTFLVGTLQWKLMPQKYKTIPMFDMLYDAKQPYSSVLSYVNKTASAVYAALAFLAVAISINAVEVVLE